MSDTKKAPKAPKAAEAEMILDPEAAADKPMIIVDVPGNNPDQSLAIPGVTHVLDNGLTVRCN